MKSSYQVEQDAGDFLWLVFMGIVIVGLALGFGLI